MARPREFEIDEVVERAMNVFWEHGYEGTSLPDLLEGMKITRGSLYKAFGSKKALFLKALQLYDQKHVQPAETMLADRRLGGSQRLAKVFKGAVKAAKDGDRRGCLLCNTSAGASAEDEEIAVRVNNQLDRLTNAFAEALKDVPVMQDASAAERRAKARSLTLSYVGLRVLARGQKGIDVLRSAANDTIAALER